MSNDALADWLARYQNPAAPEGRTRGEYLAEMLEPGDVRDDGSICHMSGAVMRSGPLWATERQTAAAVYYGWTIQHDAHGPIVAELALGRSFLVGRDPA